MAIPAQAPLKFAQRFLTYFHLEYQKARFRDRVLYLLDIFVEAPYQMVGHSVLQIVVYSRLDVSAISTLWRYSVQ